MARPKRSEQDSETWDKIKRLYFVNAWSPQEIAKVLNVSIVTVNTYVRDIRKVQRKFFEEYQNLYQDLTGWGMEVDQSFKEMIKLSWDNYTKASTSKDRAMWMDRINKATSDRLTFLQSIGVAPKAKGNDSGKSTVIYKSNISGAEEDVEPAPQKVQVEVKVTQEKKEESPIPIQEAK